MNTFKLLVLSFIVKLYNYGFMRCDFAKNDKYAGAILVAVNTGAQHSIQVTQPVY